MTNRRPPPRRGRIARAAAILIVLAAAAAVGTAHASPASAHALAVSSNPPPGATLQQAPKTVTIVFSEPPDPKLSAIQVLDTSGAQHQQGSTMPVPGQPNTLRVDVGPVEAGVYTVTWRTVSKVDGHLATGSFAFGVKVAPTGAAATSGVVHSPPASGWAVASRWLFYVGVMGLLGVAEIGLLGARVHRLRFFAGVAWVLAVGGIVGLALQQRSADSIPFSSLFGSSVGQQARDRAGPLLVAVPVLAWLWLSPRRRARTTRPVRGSPPSPYALAALGVCALASMFGDVEASHASGESSWRWVHVLTQWLHFVSAGIWLGGLVVVVAVVRALTADERRTLTRRFSNVALVAVLFIAATGFLRGLDEIRSWSGLFDTSFGRWALLKIALLAVIVVLGFLNRTRGVPRAPGTGGRLLRRVGTAEVALGAVVLVAAGFLQSLAPPSETAAAKPRPPLVYNGADFATTVRVRLQISPGLPGFNRFTVSVADYDTLRPVTGANVTLTFTLPDDPELGPSTLRLPPEAAGEYGADAANLSVGGTWTVTTLIQTASESAQVPFTVTTRKTPVVIDQVRTPGLPTVYTIHAEPTVSAQVYLDPGKPGFNEFHTTMIGNNDEEVPTRSLTVSAIAPGRPTASPLTVRRLDSIGHFVADLPGTVQGKYTFNINAITDEGPVNASITIAVP